jgi:hypothetical protein
MTNNNPLPPEIVNCSDCGNDATQDRACNGDGFIRCTSCAVAKYKRDSPLWWVELKSPHSNIRVTA